MNYGNPTPGSAGIIPTISYSGGVPFLGNPDFKIEGRFLHGAQTGFLFTGFSQASIQLDNGIWLNVLPPWSIVTVPIGGLPFPGYGTVDIPAPIPSDPSFAGVHFMNFILGTDPGGTGGFGGTDGMDSTICD